MDFFAFDKAYVERLRNGDPATEHHFFVYFEKLLNIKLRSRMISPDRIEDLKQETFIRVIAAVRKEGVRQPERSLTPFVTTSYWSITGLWGRTSRWRRQTGRFPTRFSTSRA